jgi:hypothetical protein
LISASNALRRAQAELPEDLDQQRAALNEMIERIEKILDRLEAPVGELASG